MVCGCDRPAEKIALERCAVRIDGHRGQWAVRHCRDNERCRYGAAMKARKDADFILSQAHTRGLDFPRAASTAVRSARVSFSGKAGRR